MEIFIFKFPYIANYEIISVGLAVISFCLLDIVTLTYSIDKQSAPWTGSRVWGVGGRGTTTDKHHLFKYTCTEYQCVPVVFVWKFWLI